MIMIMSSFFLDLRIALLSLFEHKRRTFLLGAAIATVTALLVLLNGLSAGIRHTLIETATTISTGHLNVGGFFKAAQSGSQASSECATVNLVEGYGVIWQREGLWNPFAQPIDASSVNVGR
jgi:hypothetical protein